MIIKACSDLHGNLIDIKDNFDILCICGDISPLNIQTNYTKFTNWFFNEFKHWIKSLPCKYVILIPGNHDFWFQKMFREYSKVVGLFDKLIILINDYIELEIDNKKLKIYGTPICRFCGNFAYVKSEQDLIETFSKIPNDIDILLTHDAPDIGEVGISHFEEGLRINYANKQLAEAIKEKLPKYVFCGHIHTGDHELKDYSLGAHLPNVKIANVSILDEEYKIKFKPLTVKI